MNITGTLTSIRYGNVVSIKPNALVTIQELGGCHLSRDGDHGGDRYIDVDVTFDGCTRPCDIELTRSIIYIQ